MLRFLLPSTFGVLLFLVPLSYNGEVTILVAVIAELLKEFLQDFTANIAVAIITLSAVITMGVSLFGIKLGRSVFLQHLFHVGAPWVILRVLGALLACMVVLGIGPDWLLSEATGSLVLHDLVSVILTYLFIAIILLPLLTDYGLMEYVGTLCSGVFRKVFGLPGRSCIDALASWMGSGTVGVMITSQQFERGYYSAREAAVISTNFSIVSIAFSLLVVKMIGLGHMFIPSYLTTVATGLVLALVMPHLPPLSRKKDDYLVDIGANEFEEITDSTRLKSAWDNALTRAQHGPSLTQFVSSSSKNVMDIWFALLPAVMAIGTVALIIAEQTPLFEWLAMPLVPLLEALSLPEASKAALALMLGFADMFLPALVGRGIESELTRFVVVTVSIVQLIFISEVGVLILKSKIPLNLLELFIIFILRTVIAVIMVTFIARTFLF
ncbi:MAG: YjiH family protein [Pseudomonadales bacterium]